MYSNRTGKVTPWPCPPPCARARAADRERAMSAGCDDFDTKPVELPRLLGKMETLLKANGIAPPEKA